MSAAPSRYSQDQAVRPMKWWHTAIIDDMILHPTDTAEVRARRLGYHKNTLYMLMNSDMFKAAYEARRSDLTSRLQDSISMRLLETADLGLKVMQEKLEKKRDTIPFRDLASANESLLTKLGYASGAASAAVQVNVNAGAPSITPAMLAEARQKLRAIEEGHAAVTPRSPLHAIDITPVPFPPQSGPLEPEVDGAARLDDIE